MRTRTRQRHTRWVTAGFVTAGAAAALAACGSSGGTSSAESSSPGTHFTTANVSGLGTVLVDGRGRTVYALTADGHHNVACSDASGCTALWPDIALPDGTAMATAGQGAQAALLGTVRDESDRYATYHGWRVYEYAGDSAAGQSHGQGVQSFGGTWYALTPAGTLVTSTSASGSSGYGY